MISVKKCNISVNVLGVHQLHICICGLHCLIGSHLACMKVLLSEEEWVKVKELSATYCSDIDIPNSG